MLKSSVMAIVLTVALSIVFLPQSVMSQDIVDTAVSAGSFNTLVAAVQAAGLEDTLRGEGPFTVFAPTDDAFAALPAGTVDSLLLTENLDQLISILTYHVAPAMLMAADVVAMSAIETVNGQALTVEVVDDDVMIDNAKVIQADIAASNGVIHVIDAVLIPSEPSAVSSSPEKLTTTWAAIKSR